MASARNFWYFLLYYPLNFNTKIAENHALFSLKHIIGYLRYNLQLRHKKKFRNKME